MHLPIISLLIASVSAGLLFRRQAVPDPVCLQIAGNITGNVYYNPADSNSTSSNNTTPNPFTLAISHWMSSSSQTPLCVVEVNDANDVSAAIKIIGSTKTPFAVKSAGYNSNPGFSSTTGVHISLEKMKQVILSEDKSTVEIGLGNVSPLSPTARFYLSPLTNQPLVFHRSLPSSQWIGGKCPWSTS